MFKATKSFFKASVLAVAAVICASCAQEDSVFGTHEKRAKDVTISVSMNETRTVNDGISTKWSANDAITLLTLPFDGTGYYPSKFTYHQDENGNRFRGRIEDYGEMNSFYAFYPYRNDILTPKDYRIDINANPVQEGNTSTAHLAGTDFPLYGKQLKVQGVSNINISMSNILAVARFVVTNTTESPIVVKSIEFTSSNYITGSFNADMTVDDPAWTADKENASTKVTLAVNNGEEIAAGGNAEFYVGILPNVCLAGSKLKIKITASNIKDYLGKEKYKRERVDKEPAVGIVRGLAWTAPHHSIQATERKSVARSIWRAAQIHGRSQKNRTRMIPKNTTTNLLPLLKTGKVLILSSMSPTWWHSPRPRKAIRLLSRLLTERLPPYLLSLKIR